MNEELLQKIPLFAQLSYREQRALAKHIQPEMYRRDEVIFAVNDDSDALYIIEIGWVSLSTDGRTTLVNLGPGSLIGDTDFFSGAPRAMTARATAEVQVWVLSHQTLHSLINSHPELGLTLSQTLARPIRQMIPYLANKLAQTSALQTLSLDGHQVIASLLTVQVVQAGHTLFQIGDEAKNLYLIERGLIRLTDDQERFYDLEPNDLFGEMALLTGKPYSQTAHAVEDSLVWFLDASNFQTVVKQYPDVRTLLSRAVTMPLSQSDQTQARPVLQGVSLFSALPPEALADIASHLLLRHVSAGEDIYRLDEPGDAMYIVESGEISLKDAQNQPLSQRTTGYVFGEVALLTGKNRTETAAALSHANLWSLSRSDFDTLLAKYPQLSAALGSSLQEHLRAADDHLVEKHLQQLATLGGLSRTQLDEISAYLYARRYQAGDIIYQEGTPSQALYFIENGQVERFASTQPGPVSLSALSSGDFFGETALLSGRPHTETVRTPAGADIWVLNKQDFDELVYKHPNFSAVVNRMMSDRMVEAMDLLRNRLAVQPTQQIPPASSSTPAPSRPRPPINPQIPPQAVSSQRSRPMPPPSPPSRPNRPMSKGTSPIPPPNLSRGRGANGSGERISSKPNSPKSSAQSGSGRPSNANSPPSRFGSALAKSSVQTQGPRNGQVQRASRKSRPQTSRNIAREASKIGSGIKGHIDNTSYWFANMPLGTKVGLFIFIFVIIWICGIAAPSLVIQALAAAIFGEDSQFLVDGQKPANIVSRSLAQNGLVAALPFVETTTPTLTPSPSPSATPSPSTTPVSTPLPTFTHTPTLTPTPEDTPTPTLIPTDTLTPIPILTNIHSRPRAPINTPAPEPTPTPDVDYIVAKVRKLTPCENAGKHHIFIRVLSASGQGLNNVPVKIAWGPNSQDHVINHTEPKDRGDGFIEYAMFKGTYSVEVMGAKSQVASGITADYQTDEACEATGDAVGNSLFHASFEVVLQRTF